MPGPARSPRQGRRGGLCVFAGSRSATGSRASSIAFIRSASSRTPEAFTFSRTCSGLDAPTIAAETFEFCSTHATASCAIESPACSASGLRPATAASTSSRMIREMKFFPLFSSVARDPAGGS
jgi:hypothetical protein